MSDYLNELDSVFWITLATIIFGSVGVMLRYCFKSKCSKVTCCCFSIERDVQSENAESLEEMNHGLNNENNV